LNRRLDFLLAVLDDLNDFPRLLDGDALLERDLLAHARSRGGGHGSVDQSFERDLAFDQFLLQDLDHGLELELVGASEQPACFLFR
jgi:hypothetical protein